MTKLPDTFPPASPPGRTRPNPMEVLKEQVEEARLLNADPAENSSEDSALGEDAADEMREYEHMRALQLEEEDSRAKAMEKAVCMEIGVWGSLLAKVRGPADVQELSLEELNCLADELRKTIIQTVAANGGHLAPSLGVIELTLALLSVFSPPDDKIVWDVGHQAYAYKLLTGRAKEFHPLRTLGGISGFPRMAESEYDAFGVGHSSTSVSAALGMAVARDLAGQKNHVLAIIGDGALTAGLAYEGLNQAGSMDRPFIVILNDNDMSIAKNVGALSLFMSRNLSSRWVRHVKREVEGFLRSIPGIGEDLLEIAKRSKHSFKNFFTPGILFEALRFNYIGPVNGHDIEDLQKVLRLAATLDKPALIHVLTHKGKGYEPAEQDPSRFHGVGRFDPETGCLAGTCSATPTYTEAFGSALCDLAAKDARVVAISAAMPEGTGLTEFSTRFPDRFFDVGICEQHAVTFAAGLATQGLRPVVAVYSTFLQRAYDQIVHDVCLQKLPVTFCLDRAGLVGEDGATHQGAFDIAYLRHIPNLVLFAPKDEAELQQGLATGLEHGGPFAMRYPRGAGVGAALQNPPQPLPVGQAEYMCRGTSGLAVIALGNRVHPAHLAAKSLLAETGQSITVLNARWVKPLPEEALKEVAQSHDKLLILEEGALAGGFGSAVLEFLSDSGFTVCRARRLGLPDGFIEHGAADILRKMLGIDLESIGKAMRAMLREEWP